MYMNIATCETYCQVSAGVWSFVCSVKGDDGERGATGDDGYGLLTVEQVYAQPGGGWDEGTGRYERYTYEVYCTDYEELPPAWMLAVYLTYGMTAEDKLCIYGQHGILFETTAANYPEKTATVGNNLFTFDGATLRRVSGAKGEKGEKGDDGEVFLPQGECGGDSVSIGSNTVSPHVTDLTDGMVILQTFTSAVPQYSGHRLLQLSTDDKGDGTGSPVIAKFRDEGEEELPAGTYLLRYDKATDHMVVVGQMITGGSALEEKVATLEEQVADLLYVPIEVTSIANSVGTVEIGSTVDEVTITWSLNKTPVQQTAGARPVDNDARTITLTGLGLTAGASFEVVATDERGTVARKATNVNVRRGVYYGVPAVGAAADSATILTLSRSLQSGRAITFTVTAGAGQHIAFALPTSYGTPTFTVGGFDGGFTKAATVLHTNASGHTEDYDLWLSDNTGLGVTTVVVR